VLTRTPKSRLRSRSGRVAQTTTAPVLVILHQERSTPGRVGHHLLSRSIALDIRRPALGDDLPETLENHSAVAIFGGPMSANDESEFIKRETQWLSVPLRENKPFLGICLGAQMLARHLGAKVATHREGKAEIGYYPIRVTDAARTVTPEWPSHVYQWHREGFALPHSAELLAEGDIFEVQAFRYGTAAYGIQFHPEVTHHTMCRWTTMGHIRLAMPGARARPDHFIDRPVYDPAVRAWLAAFLDRWV
jgi:GMP synthase (glutamine-hydrolysing)